MTERDFMRFLKENNCFYSYLINFTKRKKYNSFSTFYDWSNRRKTNLISSAFIWYETLEGFDFWNKIDKKYIYLCRYFIFFSYIVTIKTIK